jgi:hypothetical protein
VLIGSALRSLGRLHPGRAALGAPMMESTPPRVHALLDFSVPRPLCLAVESLCSAGIRCQRKLKWSTSTPGCLTRASLALMS